LSEETTLQFGIKYSMLDVVCDGGTLSGRLYTG